MIRIIEIPARFTLKLLSLHDDDDISSSGSNSKRNNDALYCISLVHTHIHLHTYTIIVRIPLNSQIHHLHKSILKVFIVYLYYLFSGIFIILKGI